MSDKKVKKRTTGGLYFANPHKEGLNFFSSGCVLLDCVVGGGWPLGRMSNIVGDKAAGKCAKDAYILSPYMGLKRLDDFDLETCENEKPFEFEKPFPLAVSKSQTVNSSHYYKEAKHTTLLKINTRHGFELECSKDHPILVWTKDCETSFKKSEDLEIGDVTIIAKNTMMFNETNCEDLNLSKLLGYLIADGINPRHGRIDICNSKDFVQNDVTELLKNLNLKSFKRKGNVGTLDKNYTNYVWELLGCPENFTARVKFVPDIILKADMPSQIAFIKGLFNCDTYAGNNNSIQYYTASEVLSKQIQLMLLNLGIVSSRVYKDGAFIGEKHYDHKYWTISIYGKYCNIFNEIIGNDKYELDFACDTKSNFDSIPFLLEKMTKDREKLKHLFGWSKNGILKNGERFPRFNYKAYNHCTWKLLDVFIKLHKKYENDFDLKFYELLQNSDFHFDPISKIENIVYDEPETTYDVHVPKHNCFWCNGFISHNTLIAIEACANFNAKYGNDGEIYYLEAEAAFDENYAAALGMPVDDVIFVHDEGEDALIADFTIEGWFEHLEAVIEKGKENQKPILYIVDSLDAMSDRAEKDRKIDEGSYAMTKQKKVSELFRRLTKGIEQTKIHLMIISQIRDKIGVSFGEKYSRSGGKAMDFYASQIVWLAYIKKLERTIRGVKRVTGVKVKAQCKKNKVGLPFRDCEFPIMFGYGIDDNAAIINWLELVKALDDAREVLNCNDKKAASLSKKLLNSSEEVKLEMVNLVIEIWKEMEEEFLPIKGKYS